MKMSKSLTLGPGITGRGKLKKFCGQSIRGLKFEMQCNVDLCARKVSFRGMVVWHRGGWKEDQKHWHLAP